MQQVSAVTHETLVTRPPTHTPAEPVAELIEILLHIFGRYPVISIQQRCFDVADSNIAPRAAIHSPYQVTSPGRHDAEFCRFPLERPAHRYVPTD